MNEFNDSIKDRVDHYTSSKRYTRDYDINQLETKISKKRLKQDTYDAIKLKKFKEPEDLMKDSNRFLEE